MFEFLEVDFNHDCVRDDHDPLLYHVYNFANYE